MKIIILNCSSPLYINYFIMQTFSSKCNYSWRTDRHRRWWSYFVVWLRWRGSNWKQIDFSFWRHSDKFEEGSYCEKHRTRPLSISLSSFLKHTFPSPAQLSQVALNTSNIYITYHLGLDYLFGFTPRVNRNFSNFIRFVFHSCRWDLFRFIAKSSPSPTHETFFYPASNVFVA